DVSEVGLGERLDGERQPLMGGTLGQEGRKPAAVKHTYRLTVPYSYGGGGRDQRLRFRFLPGEHGKPVPAPFGVGERRSHGVPAGDSACTIRSLIGSIYRRQRAPPPARRTAGQWQ